MDKKKKTVSKYALSTAQEIAYLRSFKQADRAAGYTPKREKK